jgi:hypothetical protein
MLLAEFDPDLAGEVGSLPEPRRWGEVGLPSRRWEQARLVNVPPPFEDEDDYESPSYTPNKSRCQSINIFGADAGSRETASRILRDATIAGSRPSSFETASRFARS